MVLPPRAEIAGIGWNSDAHHFTRPNPETVIRAIMTPSTDAEISPCDIDAVNAHGTSTPKGDRTEVECLRTVFGKTCTKNSSLGQQVPGRPLPWCLRCHRGGPGHRGHGAGNCPARRSIIYLTLPSMIWMWSRTNPASMFMNLCSPTPLVLVEPTAVLSFVECRPIPPVSPFDEIWKKG